MDSKLKNLYKQFSDSGRMVLSASAKQRVKDRVFQRLGEVRIEQEREISLWSKIRNSVLLKSYVLVPLAVLFLVITTGAASAHALPGDTLYPVKRQVESVRILLASSADAKLDLELSFADERLREWEEIQAAAGIQAELGNSRNSNSSQANASGNANANSRSSKRQIQARQQAENALNFLQQTQADLKKRTDDQKAQKFEKNLEQKIKEYKDRLVRKNGNESNTSNPDNPEESREDSRKTEVNLPDVDADADVDMKF